MPGSSNSCYVTIVVEKRNLGDYTKTNTGINLMQKIKYFSTFSGIGGFELGIENAAVELGIATECVGFSEVDKFAISVYQRHFPNARNYGDIKQINTDELPDFDLLVGGFPCQDVSIIGKRAGLAGERTGLFYELARILKAKQPRYFVFENVKGLLSSNKGEDFSKILQVLDELGYSVQWGVLDAQYFRSPQHRERVVIVGFLRSKCRAKVLSIRGEDGKTVLGNSPVVSYAKRRTKVIRHNYINTITASYHGVNGDGAPGIIEGDKARRLTPVECERCQMFPDNWTKLGKDGEIISDSQRYHMCGNAVCVSMMRAVFLALFEVICNEGQGIAAKLNEAQNESSVEFSQQNSISVNLGNRGAPEDK